MLNKQYQFRQLYRRFVNFVDEPEVIEFPKKHEATYHHVYPGWLAFDFFCNVEMNPDGALPKANLLFKIDGVEKMRWRADWPWTRYYHYVDSGAHTYTFETEGYKKGDVAKIRHINATEFHLCSEIAMIEQATMPKGLQTVNSIPVLNGYDRYQSSSIRGCEQEFTCIIKETKNWQHFMDKILNYYILKSNEGLYGGIIKTDDVQTIKKGHDLYLVKCTFLSDSKAGVGH
ncbi:hypothetical protein [Bacillus chungangensis]|uniref:Uncharacterized protein n=1 Tax=Bacillus chungangensis TaxID=587633 RepID=A0ABT9WVD2_9BACI|nr:hypothetical protein [Bacillus chungangensis]MDQ0176730.1 hypothetical protein [Bacillus chungangensis]